MVPNGNEGTELANSCMVRPCVLCLFQQVLYTGTRPKIYALDLLSGGNSAIFIVQSIVNFFIMDKAPLSPASHQQEKSDSGFDSQSSGGTFAAAPAFQLQAKPIQRQEGPQAADSSIEERYTNHTLTAADLTDAYVVEQFAALSIEQLFEYRRACSDKTVRAHITTLIDGKDRDPFKSYLGKQFTVSNASAVIRTSAGAAVKYVEGDTLPKGKKVGDNKTIPNGTVVYITDIKDDLSYVFAEDWGWTSLGNIQGGMFNETLSVDRAEYESEAANHQTVAVTNAAIRSGTAEITFPKVKPRAKIPKNTKVMVLEQVAHDGGNSRVSYAGNEVWTHTGNLAGQANEDGTFTVTDGAAIIRSRNVTYPTTGKNLAQGARMIILAQSQDTDPAGQYVQVGYTKKDAAGNYVRDTDKNAVWTASTNFAGGWADFKSDNARWQKGRYMGQMDVVELVGRDSSSGDQEVEKLSPELLGQYNTLRASATAAGHDIRLNSGFRSFPEQKDLWDHRGSVPTARPGRSNHQNGIAIDINTGGFSTTLYNWMKANAPALGWIRTVSGEHWHWEYRPTEAATAGYKRASVSP